MWPFEPAKSRPAKREPEPESPPESLLERLERLERLMAAMQQDWGDTLDRISRHFSRVAARERQRLHRDIDSLQTSEDAPGPTNGEPGGVHPIGGGKAALRAAVNAKRLGRA